jgi:peptide deformylase
MILPIITHPNSILRQKAKEVEMEKIKGYDIKKLVFDMKETVETDKGIGLAAPQVGHSLRIIVIFLENKKIALINPQITHFSWLKKNGEEGCLSIPGTFGFVKRSKSIRVKALDENGEEIKFKAKNLLARVIQHEVDHLDGVLFIDKAEKIFKNNG